jgi:hypothetical protein
MHNKWQIICQIYMTVLGGKVPIFWCKQLHWWNGIHKLSGKWLNCVVQPRYILCQRTQNRINITSLSTIWWLSRKNLHIILKVMLHWYEATQTVYNTLVWNKNAVIHRTNTQYYQEYIRTNLLCSSRRKLIWTTNLFMSQVMLYIYIYA